MKPHIRLSRFGRYYRASLYASRWHESSRATGLSPRSYARALRILRDQWPKGWWPA